MKKLLAVLLLCFMISNTQAQKEGFGIGIMIGEPTGINGKYWLTQTTAVDGGIAYSFAKEHTAVSLHADYLYHINDVIESRYAIPFYYGFGFRMRFVDGDENSFGARGVAGLVFQSDKIPIDLFFEFVPVFNLFPSTSLGLDLAIGGRYYLN